MIMIMIMISGINAWLNKKELSETERKQPNRKFILESHYAWFAISPGKYRKFFLIDDLLVITFDLRLEHYAQDHYD